MGSGSKSTALTATDEPSHRNVIVLPFVDDLKDAGCWWYKQNFNPASLLALLADFVAGVAAPTRTNESRRPDRLAEVQVRSFLGFRRRHRQVRRPESKGSARRIFCVFLTVLSLGLERGQTNIVWRVAVVYICIFRLSNVSCLAVLSPICIAVLESIYPLVFI